MDTQFLQKYSTGLRIHTSSEVHLTYYPADMEALLPGIKQPWNEEDHSLPVKNGGATALLQHTSSCYCLIKHCKTCQHGMDIHIYRLNHTIPRPTLWWKCPLTRSQTKVHFLYKRQLMWNEKWQHGMCIHTYRLHTQLISKNTLVIYWQMHNKTKQTLCLLVCKQTIPTEF
jgi:hypothetical protein